MPMIPEAAIAMLACARIGAIHSVVFGGFAPNELAARIDHAKAKAVITASCGVEKTQRIDYKNMVAKAISLSPHKPDCCIILRRFQNDQYALQPGREFDWEEEMSNAQPHDVLPQE